MRQKSQDLLFQKKRFFENFCSSDIATRLGVDYRLYVVGMRQDFELELLQCVLDENPNGFVYRLHEPVQLHLYMGRISGFVCPGGTHTAFDNWYAEAGNIIV